MMNILLMKYVDLRMSGMPLLSSVGMMLNGIMLVAEKLRPIALNSVALPILHISVEEILIPVLGCDRIANDGQHYQQSSLRLILREIK
jgi:hypothetical protein